MDVSIACPCPGTPHESDTVTLPEVIDFRQMLTVRQTIRMESELARERGDVLSLAAMTAIMAEAYILNCVSGWSLTVDGKPLPLTQGNIGTYLLSNWEAAEAVGDAADNLYSEKVVLPLLKRASDSLRPTPTPVSTSAMNGHGTKPPKPSKRSSTTTSPMVATGPMAASPAGASSSSQS